MGEIVGTAFGALGGAVQGARDTPDNVTTTTGSSSNTSQTKLAPQTQDQLQLQQNSLQQYLQQIALAQQYEQGIGGADQMQGQARQQASQVLNGQAFNLTPQEQAAIMGQRNAVVGQSTADVNRLLDERLRDLNIQAGERGLRGQALSQLQGDTVRTAADQYGNAVRAADLQASQQSLQQPYQRVAAQSPFIQQGATLADQMRQQALTNRANSQNPYLLQLLQNERLQTGTQTQNGTTNGQQIGKGQEGSFLGALQGFFQGGTAGLAAGTKGQSAMGGSSSAALLGGGG